MTVDVMEEGVKFLYNLDDDICERARGTQKKIVFLLHPCFFLRSSTLFEKAS